MDLRLTFNEDALNYDRMRPTYVKELFDDVIRFSSLDGRKKALEIGIGTGQASLPFLKTGCEVTAVELGGELASYSREKFREYSNFQVINQDFEHVVLENNTYDLIYSATAFHWIPQDTGYPKVYELLKSGGVLALFWNRPFPAGEDARLYGAMEMIYDRYIPQNVWPTAHNEEKCLVISDTIKQYGFIDVTIKLYYQTRTFDAESYISLLNTYSDHRAMEDDKRILLEKELIEAIESFGGRLRLHDTMDLYLARKP